MQDALRRHDALMQTAIAQHDGYVFKTIGDEFCAAFGRPEDALAAILDAHRALDAENFSGVDGLRVRAAVHTGIADERDGDYFGPALNRIARLLTIGHGGQVLVSGVTSDLVQGALPSRASLRDLGEHRLRDLARPEQVYQLISPDLAADFPPLRSLDLFPNNLPLQLKSFVGRDAEIAEIMALIERHRARHTRWVRRRRQDAHSAASRGKSASTVPPTASGSSNSHRWPAATTFHRPSRGRSDSRSRPRAIRWRTWFAQSRGSAPCSSSITASI